jgi:hypothetical protein
MTIVIGAVIGGTLGFITGRNRSCEDGGCPLTGNPVTGMLYGAVMGAMIGSILAGVGGGAS